jgi:lipopolysaccharide biosynthesis glycosyltransferase
MLGRRLVAIACVAFVVVIKVNVSYSELRAFANEDQQTAASNCGAFRLKARVGSHEMCASATSDVLAHTLPRIRRAWTSWWFYSLWVPVKGTFHHGDGIAAKPCLESGRSDGTLFTLLYDGTIRLHHQRQLCFDISNAFPSLRFCNQGKVQLFSKREGGGFALAGTQRCLGLDAQGTAAIVDCSDKDSLLNMQMQSSAAACAASTAGGETSTGLRSESAMARLNRWAESGSEYSWTQLVDEEWRVLPNAAMEAHAAVENAAGGDTDRQYRENDSIAVEAEKRQGRDALVVVANDAFVFGVLVFIHSFLQHNQETFVGDIIVMHSRTRVHLSQANREIIAAAFAEYTTAASLIRVVFHLVDEEPYIWAASPLSARALERGMDLSAFKYEVFELHSYRRAVYIDCDMVVTGSLQELFEEKHPLAVISHNGEGNREGGLHLRSDSATGICFNGGLFSAGLVLRDLNGVRLRDRLLLVLRLSRGLIFKDPGCGTTAMCDQGVMNALFRATLPSWKILSNKYNYPKRNFPRVTAECNRCFPAYWAGSGKDSGDENGQQGVAGLVEGQVQEGQVQRLVTAGGISSTARQLDEEGRRVVERECHALEQQEITKRGDLRAIHFTSGKPWTEGFGASGNIFSSHSWSDYWGDDSYSCFSQWHKNLAALRHALLLSAQRAQQSGSEDAKELCLRAAALLHQKTAYGDTCPADRPTRQEARAAYFERQCTASGRTADARCHSRCSWVEPWRKGNWMSAVWLLRPSISWFSLQMWLGNGWHCVE